MKWQTPKKKTSPFLKDFLKKDTPESPEESVVQNILKDDPEVKENSVSVWSVEDEDQEKDKDKSLLKVLGI